MVELGEVIVPVEGEVVLGEVVVLPGGAVVVALVELVVEVVVSGPVEPGLPLLLCATATPATTTRQAAAAVVRRVTRVLFIPKTPWCVEGNASCARSNDRPAPSAVTHLQQSACR